MSSEKSKEVPIKRILPEGLPLLFSDAFMVQQKDGMFVLSFLQIRNPLAITPEEIEAIESVEAHCVAQILLTPMEMRKNIEVMKENFQQFVEAVNSSIAAGTENKNQ